MTGSSCEENKCTGKAIDESCDTSEECDAGLWCNTSLSATGNCDKVLEQGERCTNDESCGYAARCYDNTCTHFAFFNDGYDMIHAQEDIERYQFLCKTLTMWKNQRGEYECVEGPVNSGEWHFPEAEEPRFCNYTITDSESQETYEITDVSAKCGYNKDSDYYCPAKQGDLVSLISADVLSLIEKFFINEEKYDCHTNGKIWRCADLQENIDDEFRPVLQAFYFLDNEAHYPEVANNPDCFKNN